jgi:hypothetical protein
MLVFEGVGLKCLWRLWIFGEYSEKSFLSLAVSERFYLELAYMTYSHIEPEARIGL